MPESGVKSPAAAAAAASPKTTTDLSAVVMSPTATATAAASAVATVPGCGPLVKYGELLILGYNGSLPQGRNEDLDGSDL